MRVKKQKRHRRAVRFYTTCFGFRQPYKILCDGTFIHHLIINRIAPADDALSNILAAPVKLFTTKCVRGELKRLGKSYFESLQAAHQLITARCDHDKLKSAEACISEVIGLSNSEHFFLATQDFEMRKKFCQVPGVPLIFGLRNSLHLEQPSEYQHEFAKASEEERSCVTELEKKLLKNKTKSILAKDEPEYSNGENEGPEDQNLEMQPVKKHISKKLGVNDKPQFKRKKAKGPNPLSCLKKKKEISKPSSEKQSDVGDNPGRSKTKTRKRSRKRKTLADSVNSSANS